MTDQELRELVAKLAVENEKTTAQMKETDRKLDKVGEIVGGIGRNLGHFAESSFVASLEKNKELAGIKFDFVHPNMKGFDNEGVEREYDIVLQNGSVIGVVEVKFRLHPDDVVKFAEHGLPKFREIYAFAKGRKIIGAVASTSIPKESITRAAELGLAVLSQEGQDIKVLSDAVRPY